MCFTHTVYIFLFIYFCHIFVVPAPRAEENSKAAELASSLNQMDKDLAQVEMDILSSLRAPLNRTDPVTDLAKRLKEQEVRHALDI